MESLTQILEEEFEHVVEVKDKKSLHRWIVLLTENLVNKDRQDETFRLLREDMHSIGSDVKEIALTMRAGFESVDKRFEGIQTQMDQRFAASDKRFEDLQEQIDRRHTASDKHFEEIQKHTDRNFARMFSFMMGSFTILAVLMSIFKIF